MSSDELANWLGCSRGQVYKMVSQGMPCVRLGLGARSEYRFSQEHVAQWLAECAGMNSIDCRKEDVNQLGTDIFGERTYIR